MIYKTSPGIVMTKICNVHLLVPTREASENCSQVMRLNLLSASVWETVEKGLPLDKTIHAFQSLLKKSEKEMRDRVQNILDLFCEKGFMIREEEPDQPQKEEEI